MKYKRKNKAEAITQILILVISIVAISWMIGDEVKVVSAEGGALCNEAGGDCIISSSCTTETQVSAGSDCTLPQVCCVPPAENKVSIGDVVGYVNTGANAVNAVGNAKDLSDSVKQMTTPNPATQEKIEGASGEQGSPGKEPKQNKLNLGIGTILGHAGVAYGIKELTRFITTEAGYTENAVRVGSWVVGGTYFVTAMIATSAIRTATAAAIKAGTMKVGAFIATKLGSALAGGVIGLGVAAVTALVYYGLIAKKQAVQAVIYNCYNWDAEPKGMKCNLCNNQDFPCTEYQCQS